MTYTYSVEGMTCNGCRAKVQELLSGIAGVKNVSIDLQKKEAAIDMIAQVPTDWLKSALKNYPKYQLEEKKVTRHEQPPYAKEERRSWWATYKPILIVCMYITGVTLLLEVATGNFNMEIWMRNFMAGFFLVFSFFKFLDIRGFADGYSRYDIIAKKWSAWGYVYAFVELGLGLAYLLKFSPLITNATTFIVTTVSITGVLQSVLNKREIKCVCLGSVFNLPMSTITILEDGLMIIMSLVSFITLL